MQMTRMHGPGFAVALIIACNLSIQSADASPRRTAAYGRTAQPTFPGPNSGRSIYRRQIPLPGANMGGLAPQIVFRDNLMGSQVRNGLPPTKMDSFVVNARVNAEHIYGDESTTYGPPPYMSFSETHRINAGITKDRSTGLTTGHSSILPDAWGRDEIMGAPEFSRSGHYDPQANGVPLKREFVSNKDKRDGVDPRQFPKGFTGFDKVDYYDEDRLRPPSDPYYQYLVPHRRGASMSSH